MPFADLVHSADRDMVLGRHQKRIAGDGDIPVTYSHRVVNKAGDALLVELSSVQIRWEGRPATLNFARDKSFLYDQREGQGYRFRTGFSLWNNKQSWRHYLSLQ